MGTGCVTVKIEDSLALISIVNPPVNVLHADVLEMLNQTFDDLKMNDEVRVVILTGTGKSFASGGDIKHFPKLNRKSAEALSISVNSMQRNIEEFDWPVIAAINGYCIGGGCELAMACDIRIASSGAMFGIPDIRLGLMPGAGGTQRLPRLVSSSRAKILLYTGDRIKAREAEKIGLVDMVVEPGQELPESKRLASKILKNAPIALRFIKKAVNRGLQMPLYDALMMESTLFGELFETDDLKEGVNAFLKKYAPEFSGK
ncbi:MAG: enoyl-CoA hydratase/isomerase family protein [Deltaproteobacteria bacterium]|nr:enoyl-CoA hydratase/isomerase family protein [Deltaproteobacteria bacterium]